MAGRNFRRKIGIISLLLTGIVCFWGCVKKNGTDSYEQVLSNNIQNEETAENIEEHIQDDKEIFPLEKDIENSKNNTEYLEQAADEQEIVMRPKVKGIFVTGPMAGTSNMEKLIGLVEETELNAIVMDIKNDEGRITYDMQIPIVQEVGADIRYIQDMEALIKECKEKNIYLIARIVAFKDPFLVKAKPEWCVHNKDGSIFQDKDGLAWLNPYEPQVWDYLLKIAEEALRIGFDEVQFDYIRFSTDSGMKNADFGTSGEEKNREEIIEDFVKYAAQRIHEAGGAISADVYGMVIDSRVDQEIVGQNYVEMSRYLDYISPMIYPSHYGPYNYDIPVPDAEPYRLVLTALQASKKALAGVLEKTVSGNEGIEYSTEEIAALMPMEGIRAQVRPWLQDFTATWVKGHINYEAEEIRAQIQAVYDAGYEEWILWNASNRYTEDGLLKEN